MEEKERVVAAEGWGWGHVEEEGIDVDEVIDVCVKMYHDVRQNAEGEFSSFFSFGAFPSVPSLPSSFPHARCWNFWDPGVIW